MATVITGGAGFVGINIASALLARGEIVVVFDRSLVPAVAQRHLESLPGKLISVIGDITNRDQLMRAITDHGVSKMVHGAAITAGLAREAREPALIVTVNTIGTIEALEAALACNLSRVVQLGTGSVYGRSPPRKSVIDEDDAPHPESLYGISKYAAESIARRYRTTRGLDIAVGRLGVVFGRWEYDTGMRDTLSMPLQLMKAAVAGESVRLPAALPDDWVYATDIASAVVGMLDATCLDQEIYQLATGHRWSVAGWCDRLKTAYPDFQYELVDDITRATLGSASPAPRAPFSVARLKAATGFTARYDEATAFDDYLAWHRELATDT
ncbi:NAD-dependent epimerase/dehydratase family protein [Tardiphaga sp.]|jgi:nucleoside-diphosphate-sugar epimerase|uniref:NAD-dependent epimerase/dehydratase family protein n=1 Tax=Tardiphaga sp. TaxID=1926292 RepID=UPI0037D9A969